uniref:RRM domain-containing protein n=1 Tax=Timema poppense TaxID=170557 RepID=A0A7R9CIG6_TIMPO|nr:unnamed protein product [Timema poppensis]
MSRYREWDLSCKVYVGNLGSSASKHEIESAFSKYGPLRNVWVARNPSGFAFVEFEDPRDAEDAVRGLDGTSLQGECAERVSEWRCRLDAAAVMGVVVGALDPRGHPRLLLNHHQPPSTSSTSCYVSGPPNNHQPTPQPNKSALLYAAPHRLHLVHHADAHVAGLAPEAVHLDALAQTRGIGESIIYTQLSGERQEKGGGYSSGSSMEECGTLGNILVRRLAIAHARPSQQPL